MHTNSDFWNSRPLVYKYVLRLAFLDFGIATIKYTNLNAVFLFVNFILFLHEYNNTYYQVANRQYEI